MRNQRKFKALFKRLISGVSALALSVGLLASIPASADDSTVGYKYTLFAYSSEEGAISSSAANFCVNGNIATNGTISAGQNFNVNGEKKEHANEAMPDLSKAINEKFFAENVDVKADNYKNEDVNINVVSPLDVKGKAELNGNIKLAAGVKAMGDIVLSGGVLNNDNTVLFSEKGNIVINSENVSLTGLVYAPKGNIVIESKSLNLNSVVMIANKITLNSSNININNSASMAKFVQESIDKNGGSNGNDEPEPEADPAIYAYGEYNEKTKSVDIEWYSNVTGEFAVLESMNGTDYTIVSKVSDDTKYSIKVASDFIKKFYKVTIIKDGKTIESIPFSIVNANGKYSTELLDTDKDGLADLYEEMLGTDKTLPDTDKDGLTDYEEAYITNTNPTKYDSVTEGVSDADADNDKDGLTNKKEIEIKTDPNSDDTDGDNLKDGDELSKYNTDPLKPDTDGDGINDGDEVLLKLDPTKTVTDGVKDSEHYFEQDIPADSKVFSEINTEDSPYTLSMKINCTGYAERNVTASESSYHSAIESEMTVGKIADISLNETCKNKEIVLYYKINNADEDSSSDSDTELKGINKYCIFSYDKKHNAAIPVMTQYDEANSTIYASVKDLGPFWVGNMQIWKDAINKVEPDKFVTTQEVIDKADIVFSINTCGIGLGNSDLKMMKENIKENAKMIFKNSKDVRIAVLGYSQRYKSNPYCTHTFLSNKSEWAANMEELTELLNQIEIDNQSQYGVLELGLQDIATPIIGVGQPYSFRDGAEIYSFVYTRSDNVSYIGNSFNTYRIDRICSLRVIIDKLKALGIRTSFVMNDENLSTISVLEYYVTDPTGGAFATYTSDEFGVNSKGVYEYLNTTAKKTIIEAPDQSFDNTVFVSSLSLQPIRLSRSLYVKSDNDTDNDGLTDWEEIDNKSYELSSDAEYGFESKSFDDVLKLNGEKEQEIRRLLKDRFGDKYYALCKLPFLFLLSDPTNQDSDGDEINDKEDDKPLEFNIPLIDKIKEMERYVDDCLSVWNYASCYILGSVKSNRNSIVTMNIIRSIRYGSGSNSLIDQLEWRFTAGDNYDSIKNYIDQKNPDIMRYFEDSKKNDYIDPNGNRLDFVHMLATLCGQYNTSVLGKVSIDKELSGWAGDLQSLIYDLKKETYGYDKNLKETAFSLICQAGTRFSLQDMLADIDAENIYNMYYNIKYLSEMLENYYYIDKVYKTRYSFFVSKYGGMKELEKRTNEFTFDNSLNPVKHMKLHSNANDVKSIPRIKELYEKSQNSSSGLEQNIPSATLLDPTVVTAGESEALTYAFITFIRRQTYHEY